MKRFEGYIELQHFGQSHTKGVSNKITGYVQVGESSIRHQRV